MKVFIVEDNTRHLALLKTKVKSLNYEVVGESQEINDALAKIKTTRPDLILVDINLHGENDGINLVKSIRKHTGALVFFITSQNASDIIEQVVSVKPDGYLLKPIDPQELKANVELAIQKQSQFVAGLNHSEITAEKDFLSVRIGERLYLLQFKDIKLLKVEDKNYVTLQDKNDKNYVVRYSLKKLIDEVLPQNFIRTHHSYAINIDYVAFIDERDQLIHLKTNDSIPIGKSFRKTVYQKMNIKS